MRAYVISFRPVRKRKALRHRNQIGVTPESHHAVVCLQLLVPEYKYFDLPSPRGLFPAEGHGFASLDDQGCRA